MAQRTWRSDDTDAWTHGFGDGSTGSTYAVPANEGCSSSLGVKTLTLATAGGFSDGDLILIHQTRGSDAGHYELNKILSGGGTTTLTLEFDTTLAYADSGSNQAQVIELNQYDGMSTGGVTAPTWNGSKGGIIAFLDKTKATINGSLNLGGIGFAGGTGSGNQNITANNGEGTSGASFQSTGANGNGGGGGQAGGGNSDGAGGGNATSGGSAGGGTGGGTSGNASLILSTSGGAGGGTASDSGANSGGRGGGMSFIFAKEIEITGSITLGGGAGGLNATTGKQGGGGAGGSCLLKAEIATLGSSLVTANGHASGSGGNGGNGRVHLDYSSSFTGTTSPTLDSTLDLTIVAGGGATGNFFLVM